MSIKKFNFESMLKRVLATTYVTGVSGGLFVSAMSNFKSSKSVFILVLQLLILIIVGTSIGAISKKIKLKKLEKVSNNGEDIEIKIADQKSFFIALAVMLTAHFLNSDMNEWNQFSAVLLTGGVFILSMVNGHIDISTYVNKSLLLLGIIPMVSSFILGYSVYNNKTVIISVWIFGLMGILSYLLVLNNSQLDSQLFSSKHINISNRKKIKFFNFRTILVFFVGYVLVNVVVINFSQIITISGKVIKFAVNEIYRGFERFTLWLLNNPKMGQGKVPDIELTGSEYYIRKSIALDVTVISLIIIAMVVMISLVVIMIKKHKYNINKKPLDEFDEFDEESAIIREKLHLHIQKKFTYTIRDFESLDDIGEKTRYLYGLIIERLYYKKVSIKKSDTPNEIMHKVFECDDGQLLEDLGFEELTEKYRQIRYGGKEIKFERDFRKAAEACERTIMNFHNK